MTASVCKKTPFFARKRNVALTAVFYTFLWGSAFPIVKLCMEGFALADGGNTSKCLLAGIRFLISGLLILCFCGRKARGYMPFSRIAFGKIACYGILSTTLQYAFTYIGLSGLTGAVGAVYDQCSVFLTVIAGGLFLRDDTLTFRKLCGCLLGFAGILWISFEPGCSGISGFLSFSLSGEGMMLCAAFCSAASYLIAKTTADKIPAVLLVGYGQLLGGTVLTAGAFLCGGRITVCPATGILTLLALSGISAAAYVLSLLPLRYFPASETSSFNLLIPVFGTALSALLLGENILQWKYPVSLIFIAAGILLINRSPRIGKASQIRKEDP